MIKDINGHTIRVGNRVLIHATVLNLDHANPKGPIAVNIGKAESASGSNISVHAVHLELHPEESPEKVTTETAPVGVHVSPANQRHIVPDGWLEREEERRKAHSSKLAQSGEPLNPAKQPEAEGGAQRDKGLGSTGATTENGEQLTDKKTLNALAEGQIKSGSNTSPVTKA